MPSPSSLLKLPFNLHMHTTFTVRQSSSLNLTTCVETHWYVLRLDQNMKAGKVLSNKRYVGCETILERIKKLSNTFTSNGKREFVPREQVSPLLVVYCSLFFHILISSFTQFFIHKNSFELFLSALILFLEIIYLNLTFAVCRTLEPQGPDLSLIHI